MHGDEGGGGRETERGARALLASRARPNGGQNLSLSSLLLFIFVRSHARMRAQSAANLTKEEMRKRN